MVASDSFSAVLRVWCVHELMKLVYAPSLSAWVVFCFGLLSFTAAYPTPHMAIVALAVRLLDSLVLVPVIWDSYYWCLQLDGGLLLLLLGQRAWLPGGPAKSSYASWWAETARLQLAVFYFASGFWKLNSSFLNVHTSCAPMFLLTLLQTVGLAPPASIFGR